MKINKILTILSIATFFSATNNILATKYVNPEMKDITLSLKDDILPKLNDAKSKFDLDKIIEIYVDVKAGEPTFQMPSGPEEIYAQVNPPVKIVSKIYNIYFKNDTDSQYEFNRFTWSGPVSPEYQKITKSIQQVRKGDSVFLKRIEPLKLIGAAQDIRYTLYKFEISKYQGREERPAGIEPNYDKIFVGNFTITDKKPEYHEPMIQAVQEENSAK